MVDLVGIEPATFPARPGRVSAAAAKGFLVDLVGIEPTTSSMPWKRAPSCATGPLRGKKALDQRLIHSLPPLTLRQTPSYCFGFALPAPGLTAGLVLAPGFG